MVTLACASHFRKRGLWFLKKKKSCKLLEYPKARFEKRGAGEKRSGFPPVLPIKSPEEDLRPGFSPCERCQESGLS